MILKQYRKRKPVVAEVHPRRQACVYLGVQPHVVAHVDKPALPGADFLGQVNGLFEGKV